jgi:hypothetical protein
MYCTLESTDMCPVLHTQPEPEAPQAVVAQESNPRLPHAKYWSVLASQVTKSESGTRQSYIASCSGSCSGEASIMNLDSEGREHQRLR